MNTIDNYLIGTALIVGINGQAAASSGTTSEFDICTAELLPAISVRVLDSKTSAPISCGSILLISDGDFYQEIIKVRTTDSKGNCVNSAPLVGALGRPGYYSIVVSKLGYQDFVSTDIVVTKDECATNTHEIEVYLSQ